MNEPTEQPDENFDQKFELQFERWRNAENARDLHGSLSAMNEIFALAAETCEANPDEYSMRREAARECLERGDWDETESIWRDLLRIAASEGGNRGHAEQWHLWNDLSNLHLLLGREDQAYSDSQKATFAARQADSEIMLTQALGTQAFFALKKNETAIARRLVDEALQLARASYAEMNLPVGAFATRVLVLDAMCCLQENRIVEAQALLKSVREKLWPRLDNFFMAGNQRVAALWWEANAELCTLHNYKIGVAESLREAVEKCRSIASLPHVAGVFTTFQLAKMLERFGHAAVAANDLVAGAAALNESRNLLRQIGL